MGEWASVWPLVTRSKTVSTLNTPSSRRGQLPYESPRREQGLIAKSSVPHATPAGPIWRRIQSGLLGNHETAAMSLVGAFAPCGNPKLTSLVPSDLPLISDTTATNQDSRHPEIFSSWLMARVYAVSVVHGIAPCHEGSCIAADQWVLPKLPPREGFLWPANIIYPLIASGVKRIGDRFSVRPH